MPTPRPLVSVTSLRVEIPGAKIRSSASRSDSVSPGCSMPFAAASDRRPSVSMPLPSSETAITT